MDIVDFLKENFDTYIDMRSSIARKYLLVSKSESDTGRNASPVYQTIIYL